MPWARHSFIRRYGLPPMVFQRVFLDALTASHGFTAHTESSHCLTSRDLHQRFQQCFWSSTSTGCPFPKWPYVPLGDTAPALGSPCTSYQHCPLQNLVVNIENPLNIAVRVAYPSLQSPYKLLHSSATITENNFLSCSLQPPQLQQIHRQFRYEQNVFHVS